MHLGEQALTFGHHREARNCATRASAARMTDISEMRVRLGEMVFLIPTSVLHDGGFFFKNKAAEPP